MVGELSQCWDSECDKPTAYFILSFDRSVWVRVVLKRTVVSRDDFLIGSHHQIQVTLMVTLVTVSTPKTTSGKVLHYRQQSISELPHPDD